MTEILRRFRAMAEGEAPADDGALSMVMSTADAVDFGGYREVLMHGPDCVDTAAARALLVNHDPNQIAGHISGVSADGKQMTGRATVHADARLATGVRVIDAIRTGALRGVSIGYKYARSDADYDEATRTVTVRKWRLLEATLTPIPADARAHVRALPADFTNAALPAANKKESPMSDDAKNPQGTAVDESKRAAEIAAARGRAADVVRITKVAESHNLRASDYLDAEKCPDFDAAVAVMLADKAKRDATKSGLDFGAAAVAVTRDAGDKAIEAATDSMCALHGIPVGDGKNVERGLSVHDIAKRHARRMGVDIGEWNRYDAASCVAGKKLEGSRAANVTSSNFNTVVLGNFMDKAVFNGFNNFGKSVTWPIWTRRKTVSDFKTFGIGALDSGNLVETVENMAFPELTKAEGSYSSALGLYGATISLTLQALVNDDLGEFANMLGRAGAIAQRTIDKAVYTLVNAATWTNNTTSGIAGLATAADLSELRAAFDKKTGPAGEIIGNTPRFLLVPSCLRTQALTLTTQVQAYPTVTNVNTDLQTVVTPHLTEAGTPSQSTVYLAGDPSLVDTVVVAFLSGMESPQIAEYDAGATAARKWKIMMPFVPVLASTTVGGTIYIPGMQQGTN